MTSPKIVKNWVRRQGWKWIGPTSTDWWGIDSANEKHSLNFPAYGKVKFGVVHISYEAALHSIFNWLKAYDPHYASLALKDIADLVVADELSSGDYNLCKHPCSDLADRQALLLKTLKNNMVAASTASDYGQVFFPTGGGYGVYISYPYSIDTAEHVLEAIAFDDWARYYLDEERYQSALGEKMVESATPSTPVTNTEPVVNDLTWSSEALVSYYGFSSVEGHEEFRQAFKEKLTHNP